MPIGVVEEDGATFVATREQIHVYRLDIQVATVPAPPHSTWSALAVINALDANGRWVVATDRDGGIWRVRDDGSRVPVGDRLGVDHARAVSAAGSTSAFGLDDAIAIADGQHVSRYPVTGLFAAGPGRLARATQHGVELWDLARATRVTFAVEQPTSLAFAGATLIVGTKDAVFVETSRGLRRLDVAGLRAISVAEKVWVLGAKKLFVLEGTSLVPSNIEIGDVRALFGSGSSLWVARTTALERYDEPRSDDDRAWTAQVAPIFRRACASCHLPRGPAGLDLSSPTAWRVNRSKIRTRVVVDRSMPPKETEISDDDRRTIDAWISRRPGAASSPR